MVGLPQLRRPRRVSGLRCTCFLRFLLLAAACHRNFKPYIKSEQKTSFNAPISYNENVKQGRWHRPSGLYNRSHEFSVTHFNAEVSHAKYGPQQSKSNGTHGSPLPLHVAGALVG